MRINKYSHDIQVFFETAKMIDELGENVNELFGGENG
jgi:hypothetical protein